MRIMLVGGKKTGKSSCGNTILGRQCFNTDTQTTSCTETQGKISSKTVTVLDTPGCFSVTSDLLMPTNVVLLVVNVSSSFRDSHWEGIEEQLEAGGGQLWSKAVVLFSHGDWLGNTSIEQRIESEGELLQRLVEKCGHRYHVLDNKHWGDGAQVTELLELVEEMLVEERLAVLHRGDHLCKRISSAREQQQDFKELVNCRHQLSHDFIESATFTSCPSLNCSEGPDDATQTVALPAGGAGGQTRLTFLDGFMFCLASVLHGKGPKWPTTINLPIWFPRDDPHTSVRLSGKSQVNLCSPRHPTVLLTLPERQDGRIVEENTNLHCRKLIESGDLQGLIDKWGNSSLEELEAFIDSYFGMVWEQTTGSFQMAESNCFTTDRCTVGKAGDEEVISSIDKKLSKLELLEGIRSDLAELRDGLEHSWKAIRELRDKSKQDPNNTC
uniref:AIG1-type G domain-containing protein n=1 Tax=Mastacembelus armatus TaxID=205130 RepID=A0A3Q3N8C1_9TELE